MFLQQLSGLLIVFGTFLAWSDNFMEELEWGLPAMCVFQEHPSYSGMNMLIIVFLTLS